MARWRWNTGGVSVYSLYERTPFSDDVAASGQLHSDFRGVPPTTTLLEVVARLGLDQPSERDERRVRLALGAVIEAGIKAWQLSTAASGLRITDVQAVLRRIAKTLTAASTTGSASAGLEEIQRILHGAETGFHHAHDTAIALLITSTLAQETDQDRAHDRVLNWRRWPRTVAAACLEAGKDLDKIEGRGGRPSLGWYRDFKSVLMCIAKRNTIPPTVEINRETGKAQGRFIELAECVEELLPPMLRSPTSEAMAKRLQSNI